MTFEKDKEDQSKYYLSYPKSPPVLDIKWENHDITVVEWENISKFPVLLNGNWRNNVLRLMECLTPSFHFDYLWITI